MDVKSKTIIIESFYLSFFLLAFISIFLSYAYFGPPWLSYILGTYEGLLLIFIAMILLLKLKVTPAMALGFIGSTLITLNILLITGLQLLIGAIFLIIALVGFYSINFSLIHLKKAVKSELQAKRLILKQGPTKSIRHEIIEPQIDYKKRLFGMIRLRKEIDLHEAAAFFKIDPEEIESLLYDLAGEQVIQGRFQGSKFFVESDIDQFIDVLDHSFKRWEEPQERYKVE